MRLIQRAWKGTRRLSEELQLAIEQRDYAYRRLSEAQSRLNLVLAATARDDAHYVRLLRTLVGVWEYCSVRLVRQDGDVLEHSPGERRVREAIEDELLKLVEVEADLDCVGASKSEADRRIGPHVR